MATPEPVLEMRGCAIAAADDAGHGQVRDVDWRVLPGERWAVGGLPSSGKTRLLETAAGLCPPPAGQVRLLGHYVAALGEREARALRRQVGFVYGDGGRLLSHLTLAQNLALPLCYHRNCELEAVADELGQLLAAFELEAVARRLPGQVTPAFRQRAALARALALQPQVLLLDNPLAPLNTAHTHWWLDFLSGADIGWPCPATVVAVTDDLRPWLDVAGQFALIQDIRWLVVGGRERLTATTEPVLRELLAAGNAPA
jgi:ABC-type transporter Mla maintaining outer membrane lipid asymmetry ATPase subunit MlaF